MNRPSCELKVTAYHEAGHAVAAISLDMFFEYVTVTPSADGDGSIAYSTDGDDEFPVDPAMRAVFILAGPIAEAKFTRRSLRRVYAGQKDADDVAALGLSDDRFSDAARLALELVDRRWNHIKAVASELQHR